MLGREYSNTQRVVWFGRRELSLPSPPFPSRPLRFPPPLLPSIGTAELVVTSLYGSGFGYAVGCQRTLEASILSCKKLFPVREFVLISTAKSRNYTVVIP